MCPTARAQGMRVVAALCALVFLSGCVNVPSGGGGGGSQDQVVPIEVTGATVEPGRCFDGATAFGEVCHVLNVRVDNSAFTNSRDVGALVWKAAEAAGRSYTHAQTSRDSIPGGQVTAMSVSFTLPDSPARLATLSYDMFNAHGSADIPAY